MELIFNIKGLDKSLDDFDNILIGEDLKDLIIRLSGKPDPSWTYINETISYQILSFEIDSDITEGNITIDHDWGDEETPIYTTIQNNNLLFNLGEIDELLIGIGLEELSSLPIEEKII